MQTTSPYKTAAELGIEQWEHDGLVALIGPLSRGELGLNMKSFHICDTVHCIGGWMFYNAGRRVSISKGYSASLEPLFFPRHSEAFFDAADTTAYQATGPQAARAIVNFLTLGDPRWDDVMREPAADFDADDSGAMQHVVERESV